MKEIICLAQVVTGNIDWLFPGNNQVGIIVQEFKTYSTVSGSYVFYMIFMSLTSNRHCW